MSEILTGTELECFIAGVISTHAPFDELHPVEALPIAKAVLDAIAKWVPDDDVCGYCNGNGCPACDARVTS